MRISPWRAGLVLIAVFVLMQLVPVHHDNPPETHPLTAAPLAAMAILNRACANCHSHLTDWPWYSYVAPVSWLVARDVHEGRRHLDLSTWGDYPPALRLKKLAGISGMVQEGDMPPWYYLPMHPAARLAPDDVMVISDWADNAEP
jgi:hypothetical protein